MKHKPLEEQQAIIDAVAEPSGPSVMVAAGAGCAKSTTLEMSAPGIKDPALGLAFNKKIQMELAPKMPSNFTVKTLNALGHGAWMRANPQVRMQLEDRKLGKIINEVTKERDFKLTADEWDAMRQLVTKVMQYGVTPGDQGQPINKDSPEMWKAIAEEELWMERGTFETVYEMAHEVLERSVAQARGGVISFDDQIYCSVCLGGFFAQYPVVFVDEAQDLSPLNHAMLRKSLRPGGRLIAVGDPRQAIYAFRGADSRSMETMRELQPRWKDLGLNVTFRCPKSVVARQLEHNPEYKAFHTNCEGSVKTLYQKPFGVEDLTDEGWGWKQITELLPGPGVNPVILCRNNAPLMGMAFKLLRQNIGVTMLGRDIGKSLIALARKIIKGREASKAEVIVGLIREWMEHECAVAKANDQEHKVESICDRGECLLAVMESTECRDGEQMIGMLQKLFSRENGQVVLSTGHRYKGMENDLIIHLDPWRLPSKWARKALADGNPAPMQQERNLKYVIETRTKHTLLMADLEGFR